MGFANDIVGGVGNLIRSYIRSPNYVAGVSGWSINQDGSAEFTNILARGDLSGSTLTIPAGAGPGTPRIIVDSTGITAYNASNVVVLSITAPVGTALKSLFADYIYSETNNHNVGIQLNATLAQIFFTTGLLAGNGTDFLFADGTDLSLQKNAAGINRFGVSNLPVGGVYWDRCVFTGNATTSAFSALAVPGSSKLWGAYASGWGLSGGVTWTCPESGAYDVAATVYCSGGASAGSFAMQFVKNGGAINEVVQGGISPGGVQQGSAHIAELVDFVKGDTLQIQLSTSVVSTIQAAKSHVTIARRPIG